MLEVESKMAACPPGLMSEAFNFGTKHCRNTFRMSFSTNLTLSIHLVILLRSTQFNEMHLYQGQAQIMLKTLLHYLHYFANVYFSLHIGLNLCNIVKLHFQFNTVEQSEN